MFKEQKCDHDFYSLSWYPQSNVNKKQQFKSGILLEELNAGKFVVSL